MKYAVCCKSCGHIEDTAWIQKGVPGTDAKTWERGTEPLTPRSQAPAYCQKCGARAWRVPATAEDIAKAESKVARTARATVLCRALDVDGLFKIPDGVRSGAEVKNALSNLLAPLEGEVLKQAQANVLKIAQSGVAAEADVWVEMYERAVQKAVESAKSKGTKVPA